MTQLAQDVVVAEVAQDVVSASPPVAKNPWLSKGVVGGALAAIAGVAMLFGLDFSTEDAKTIGDSVDTLADKAFEIASIVGGVLAIIGRIKANSAIKFPWQKG